MKGYERIKVQNWFGIWDEILLLTAWMCSTNSFSASKFLNSALLSAFLPKCGWCYQVFPTSNWFRSCININIYKIYELASTCRHATAISIPSLLTPKRFRATCSMQHTSTGRGQSWLTSQASVPDNHAQPLGLSDVSVSKAMMMEIKMRSISDVNLCSSHVAKQLQQMPDFQNSSSVPGCIISCSIMSPFQEMLMSWCDIACLDLHLSGLELLGLRSTTWRRHGTCFLWYHTKWTCSEHVSCWQERITATLM